MAHEEADHPKVFVREATGLVKEINSFHAAFYAITGTVGITAGLSLVYLVLYPVNIVYGLPISSWVTIIAGLMYIALGVQYAFLAGLMPRTGGDYVFTSRILSPAWGFVEGWMGVFAWIGFNGFSLYYAIYFLGVSLKIGAFLPSGQIFVTAANWIFSIPGELTLSVPFILFFIYIMGIRPTHTWLRINSSIGLIALICVALVVGLFLASRTGRIDSNLVSAAGVNRSQVITAATNSGFAPAPLTLIAYGGLLFNGIFWFTGYQFATYLSGEIKGNVRRVVMSSILAELAVSIILASLFFLPLIYSIGYNFSNSWSALYLAGSANTPLGSPPVPPLLLTLVNPGLAGVAIVLGVLILVGFEVATIIAAATFCTRLIFAFSMDRILPTWFSRVRENTGTPMNATLVMLGGAYLFFLAIVFGFNPASTAYWATLLILPMLFFPAVNTSSSEGGDQNSTNWRRSNGLGRL